MRAALRQLAATLRHRPAVLAGTLIAITLSSMIIVISASFVGTGVSTVVPPDRLAGATVVVTGRQQVSVTFGRGEDAETERLALPGYRRVPAALARRLAAIPGVTRAVADVSFPVALDLGHGRVITETAVTGPSGSRSTVPVTGHGWPSAALAPFRLVAGTVPAAPGQIVIGAGLARSSGLHLGSEVRLAGRDLPALRVVGVAADGRAGAASATSVFFAAAQAAALYGHPGQADLVGVTGASGAAPAALARRITAVLPSQYSVVTGAERGPAEDLAAATDNLNLLEIGGSAGIDVVLIALFVVAGTVALAVGQRHHDYALARAIGASPGQVRVAVLAELAALGLLGGVLGWVPGLWLAAAGMRAMVSHGLMPSATVVWQSPLLLLVATGTGVIVAMLSGLLAARRAGRVRPADALREAQADRRWPHPVRIVLGAGALAGSGALVFAMSRVGGASQQLGLALSLLLTLMITIALLGPVLVAAAELVLRPARGCGVGGRLALADIRARPRRMASAVIPIALGIAFAGTVYFLDATIAHAAQVQGRQRLIASDVVTAPGPGLAPAALAAVTRQPGVTAAVGLTPASIVVDDPDLDLITGEVVAGGPLPSVLDLGVTAGRLRGFGPGDIAVSQQEAAGGEMGVRVGDRITVRLPDGARYRARVTAIYGRSVGFADVMIPAAAAAGHLGSDAIGQILVQRTAGAPSLTAMTSTGLTGTGLTARFAGLQVASRQVVNAQYQRLAAQQDLVSDMILGVIVLLAAVTVVNTLVMATADRRQMLLLLRRVGATPRQLLSMTACQSAVATVVGIGLGTAAAATTLITVARAATGGGPYVPLTPGLVITGTVLALTMAATIGPAAAILAAAER